MVFCFVFYLISEIYVKNIIITSILFWTNSKRIKTSKEWVDVVGSFIKKNLTLS